MVTSAAPPDAPVELPYPDILPVLGHSARYLAGLAADPRTSLKGLARAVMGDPGLALRLLHGANRVPHRHFRSEVSTLEDAIRMLGTQRITRVAAEADVADKRLDTISLQRYRRAAGQSLLAGLIAADLAESRHDLSPQEVALAALLNNLGELCMLARGDRRIGRYLELVDDLHVLPHEAEYVTLGESLEDMGYALAERWHLPEMIREAMRARNALHMRTLGVMLSAQLARHALCGWRHPMLPSDLAMSTEYLDVSPEVLAERLNRIIEAFNGEASRYGLEPLAMLVSNGRDASEYRAHFCLAPRTDHFAMALARLRGQSIPQRKQVIETLCRGLHHGLGLNRVAYAGLSPGDRILAAEYLQGTDFEPAFNRYRLPLDQGGLLARLMEKPAALWLNEDNRVRLWPLVPEAMRELIGVQGFFVMSVFVDGVATGLVYADRRCAQCRLDARAYDGFRALVRAAVQNLERLSNGQRS